MKLLTFYYILCKTLLIRYISLREKGGGKFLAVSQKEFDCNVPSRCLRVVIRFAQADTLHTLSTTPNTRGPDMVYGSYTLTETETEAEIEIRKFYRIGLFTSRGREQYGILTSAVSFSVSVSVSVSVSMNGHTSPGLSVFTIQIAPLPVSISSQLSDRSQEVIL